MPEQVTGVSLDRKEYADYVHKNLTSTKTQKLEQLNRFPYSNSGIEPFLKQISQRRQSVAFVLTKKQAFLPAVPTTTTLIKSANLPMELVEEYNSVSVPSMINNDPALPPIEICIKRHLQKNRKSPQNIVPVNAKMASVIFQRRRLDKTVYKTGFVKKKRETDFVIDKGCISSRSIPNSIRIAREGSKYHVKTLAQAQKKLSEHYTRVVHTPSRPLYPSEREIFPNDRHICRPKIDNPVNTAKSLPSIFPVRHDKGRNKRNEEKKFQNEKSTKPISVKNVCVEPLTNKTRRNLKGNSLSPSPMNRQISSVNKVEKISPNEQKPYTTNTYNTKPLKGVKEAKSLKLVPLGEKVPPPYSQKSKKEARSLYPMFDYKEQEKDTLFKRKFDPNTPKPSDEKTALTTKGSGSVRVNLCQLDFESETVLSSDTSASLQLHTVKGKPNAHQHMDIKTQSNSTTRKTLATAQQVNETSEHQRCALKSKAAEKTSLEITCQKHPLLSKSKSLTITNTEATHHVHAVPQKCDISVTIEGNNNSAKVEINLIACTGTQVEQSHRDQEKLFVFGTPDGEATEIRSGCNDIQVEKDGDKKRHEALIPPKDMLVGHLVVQDRPAVEEKNHPMFKDDPMPSNEDALNGSAQMIFKVTRDSDKVKGDQDNPSEIEFIVTVDEAPALRKDQKVSKEYNDDTLHYNSSFLGVPSIGKLQDQRQEKRCPPHETGNLAPVTNEQRYKIGTTEISHEKDAILPSITVQDFGKHSKARPTVAVRFNPEVARKRAKTPNNDVKMISPQNLVFVSPAKDPSNISSQQ